MPVLSVTLNLGAETIIDLRYTFVASAAIRSHRPIELVFLTRCFAEIRPLVIRYVLIDVVDLFRPESCHVKPRKSGCDISRTEYMHPGSAFIVNMTSLATSSHGQGFPNVPQTPGAILSGLNAPQQGRTAILAYHNGLLYTVPEEPSSQPGADFQVRTWDLSDPSNPVIMENLGTTA